MILSEDLQSLIFEVWTPRHIMGCIYVSVWCFWLYHEDFELDHEVGYEVFLVVY